MDAPPDLDKIDTDAPIFDPAAFRLGEEEAELTRWRAASARRASRPAPPRYDRDASFPTENYDDMRARRPARHLRARASTAASAPASAPTASPPPRSAATAAPPR